MCLKSADQQEEVGEHAVAEQGVPPALLRLPVNVYLETAVSFYALAHPCTARASRRGPAKPLQQLVGLVAAEQAIKVISLCL